MKSAMPFQDDPVKQAALKKRERRAYIVLVFISIFLSVASYLSSVESAKRTTENGERAFCDIVNAIVANPVPKPTDIKKHPSREQAYEYYLKFKVLDRRLGCLSPSRRGL